MIGLLILLLVLIIIAVPIAYSFLASALVYIIFITPYDLMMPVQQMLHSLDSFSLLAVPFFLLLGSLMETTGVADRLVRFATSLVGFMRGGLAQGCMLSGMFMACVSGSANADATALGTVLIPSMKKEGYPPTFAASVVAAAAIMGPIIPPSIFLIFYGAIANVSVGKLFLGGFIPGILMYLSFSFIIGIMARHYGFGERKAFNLKNVYSSTKGAIGPLFIPMIVIGGIVFGFFTPTEAGAIAVLVVLVIGIKKLSMANIIKALRQVTAVLGPVMIVVTAAAIIAHLLTLEQISESLTPFFSQFGSDKLLLMTISIAVVIVGCFMEGLAILMILIPVFFPIVTSLGVDPVAFGVIMVFAITVGMVTPPVGLVMFIVCSIANVSLIDFFKHFLPFFIGCAIVLILMIFFPIVITFLPNLLMK